VATAAKILGHALAPSTSASYQRLWVLFSRFCDSARRIALSASQAAVCEYLGTLFEGHKFRGSSLRPYIAAIGTSAPPAGASRPNLAQSCGDGSSRLCRGGCLPTYRRAASFRRLPGCRRAPLSLRSSSRAHVLPAPVLGRDGGRVFHQFPTCQRSGFDA
jgi:hypothetical protein